MTLWTFSEELVPLLSLMLPLTSQFSKVMLFLPSTTKASEFSAVRAAFFTVMFAVE